MLAAIAAKPLQQSSWGTLISINNTILFVLLAFALVSVTGLTSTVLANAITYKAVDNCKDVTDGIHAIIQTNPQG
jgi:hypothetical protein